MYNNILNLNLCLKNCFILVILQLIDIVSTPAVHLKTLLETATDVGAHDFVELVRTTGLVEKLENRNVTLFAPSDDAIRDFSDSMQEANQVEFYIPGARAKREVPVGANMKNIVQGHIVPGLHDISDLVDEQV